MKQYKQLAREERYLISQLLHAGWSQRAIAASLGRAPSTVSREIRRNATTHDGAYRHCKADRYAVARRRRCRRGSKFTPQQYALVRRYLRKKWSPKQIVGTLRPLGLLEMSHESIYRYLLRDKKAGGSLWRQLRLKMKLRRKRYGRHDWRGILRGKKHISERPPQVELRQEVGHWEGDTVVGKDLRHSILTLVERATGLTVIRKLKARNAKETNKALRAVLRKYGDRMKTITFDNGTEFHDYEEIEKEFAVDCYFATPYHSWERGTNENTNGLIRQYLPKGSCMKNLTQAKCDWIARQLNTRPRERYDFKTPEMMYGRP
ncbi:MAG: IS30 family transposase [Aquabacterium sp.]